MSIKYASVVLFIFIIGLDSNIQVDCAIYFSLINIQVLKTLKLFLIMLKFCSTIIRQFD